MNEDVTFFRIKLKPTHIPTGKTRHVKGRKPVPSPDELRIVQLTGDPGFYLFHYDKHGEELTDTYHDSVEEAMEQARWEFGIEKHEWSKGSS